MADYWIDSSVLTEGKKGPYGFDIAPRFWRLLDDLIAAGRITCPITVYDELRDAPDELREWTQSRRQSGLFVEPDAGVQQAFTTIVEYVMTHYPDNQARRRFLDRADPWLIAHATAQGGAVVTLERRVASTSAQVMIPNVCDHFGIRCITTYDMLRELGVSWSS